MRRFFWLFLSLLLLLGFSPSNPLKIQFKVKPTPILQSLRAHLFIIVEYPPSLTLLSQLILTETPETHGTSPNPGSTSIWHEKTGIYRRRKLKKLLKELESENYCGKLVFCHVNYPLPFSISGDKSKWSKLKSTAHGFIDTNVTVDLPPPSADSLIGQNWIFDGPDIPQHIHDMFPSAVFRHVLVARKHINRYILAVSKSIVKSQPSFLPPTSTEFQVEESDKTTIFSIELPQMPQLDLQEITKTKPSPYIKRLFINKHNFIGPKWVITYKPSKNVLVNIVMSWVHDGHSSHFVFFGRIRSNDMQKKRKTFVKYTFARLQTLADAFQTYFYQTPKLLVRQSHQHRLTIQLIFSKILPFYQLG